MKTQSLINSFRDSPTYGRDRAVLISGFSVGVIGVALNKAVLLLLLPLLLDPNDRDFRMFTENVDFGQLLSQILLGGAAVFATVLIPLRMITVFWGPRVGRYFDQIVLSGISPFRFMIGKATSQNLFLALVLFLLLPYLVLSLTLGGVNPGSFVAGLFLVWLYCMALALVMLWASLYFNEMIAAVFVMGGAAIMSVLGFVPLPIQPFVITPFPALIHPVYSSIPYFDGQVAADAWPLFVSCAAGMSVVICVSMYAIYLGPLFGIIRENSTFGEVVRAGDSKRKRWLRLRLHIQRPSEIAFFYENRSDALRGREGLLRWGPGLCGLLLLSGAAASLNVYVYWTMLPTQAGKYWAYFDFPVGYLVVHGIGLALGVFLFSHAKNSTYLRLSLIRGRTLEVARLDTLAFGLFMLISTTVSICTPFLVERFIALPAGQTVFPDAGQMGQLDLVRVATEGSLVISVAGLVVYALHRFNCLVTWVKSVAFVGTAGLYLFLVCLLPLLFLVLFDEVPELRSLPLFRDVAPTLGMASPFGVMMYLFDELGSEFRGVPLSTVPFYLFHGFLLGLLLLGIRRLGRNVREQYPDRSSQEAA